MGAVTLTVEAHGPLAAGRGIPIIDAYLDRMQQAVAEEGKALVLQQLGWSLKTRTPYYETQIQVESIGGEPAVTDGGVIYGHWLEGTGSRNWPVTRFPGYGSFRFAKERLIPRVPEVITNLLREMMSSLGGS
jgi:hypothetical protein